MRYSQVSKLFNSKLDTIRKIVGENDICIMMDETSDRCERLQINVLVSVLNGERSKPMLMHVEFASQCDASAIFRIFIKSCNLPWRTDDPPYERVKLFLSDQTAYMLAAGRNIKTLCPSMMHVTCLAHCLNRVAECVRNIEPTVDEFLGKFKEVLRCSPIRKEKFRNLTSLPLPPKPVITRWTTWLQAARFTSDNIEQIKSFIASLNSSARTVESAQHLVKSDILSRELFSLTDFYFLIRATEQLQESSMKLSEAFTILRNVGDQLEEATSDQHSKKFELSLNKNPDLEKLCTNSDLTFRIKTKFAPVVTADVERSFSLTKKILAYDRCNFKEENLKMYYVIAYKKFLATE